MLVFISLYQITIGIVSLFLFTRTVLAEYGNMTNGQLFVAVLISVFLIYYLYTNFCILFKRKIKKSHLQLNIWTNFIQIVQLTLLSVSYKMVIGMEVAPFFLYSEEISFGIKYAIFNIKLNLSYDSSQHDLRVGINIIPLVIFFMLNAQFNKKDNSQVI